MSQTLNLSVSGLYTSINDFNGLPPGALDEADNVESRFKNVAEPRRGFDELPSSAVLLHHFIRLTNFYVSGTDRVVGLNDSGDLSYYNGSGWTAVPGDYSTDLLPPDSQLAKCRFLRAGQNLYLTTSGGVKSLSSGTSGQTMRAGVPKGLNCEAATNGDTSGFLSNNTILATTGTIADGSPLINNLDSTVDIVVGQYVTGIDVTATKVIQDLTYTSTQFGVLGNATSIAYTTGGTAGAEVVSLVGSAISVKIQSGTSTATQVRAAVTASAPASVLVTVAVTGTGSTPQTAPVGPTALTGGLDNTIPAGTTVETITPQEDILVQTGNIAGGVDTITSLGTVVGLAIGQVVSGTGIPEGSRITAVGMTSVTLDQNAFQTATGNLFTFSNAIVITMSDDADGTGTDTPISFYDGSQVSYCVVFGRTETDINGTVITRLGTPSSVAYVTNTTSSSTDCSVTATLPKNSDTELTFVQLYRSFQTASIDVSPLAQFKLVYERALVAGDFTARTISITDTVPESLMGAALYSGSDQEGANQTNDPPPLCWDMAKFRDFTLFGNVTYPTSLNFTILAVGSPNGIQNGDTITIAGEYLSVPYSEAYTAASSEVAASRQFKVFSSGTPSQNIADTTNSLIRVINYDEALPVHAILLSSQSDLPGQILLEADDPSLETFTATASAHATAYDPTLTAVVSEINSVNNNVAVSKSGIYEAVPRLNVYPVGDTSSEILRMIALRDYVVVIKSDGIYKIIGIQPGGLVVTSFDLTTKIIGPDTAVSLNSSVYMLSNQGVVAITDGGVQGISIPIDDQLNLLIGSYRDNLEQVSFAIGYESDRKYILSVPSSDDAWTEIQYNYNYVTSCWTTWSRNFYAGFIHSNDGKLYISRADASNQSVSKERKSFTYRDYVDEAIANTITSVSGATIGLTSTDNVAAGDILYQDSTHFSPIVDVDLVNSTVTVQYELSFSAGAVDILQAFECTITWKQVFADNPAYVRQYGEGVALFKNTRFNTALMRFVTDFSKSTEEVTITGTGNALWGLFAWGEVPWGGTIFPSSIRFYIPANKQLGSYILPSMIIKQGYSDFKFQGLAMQYSNVSFEVGK